MVDNQSFDIAGFIQIVVTVGGFFAVLYQLNSGRKTESASLMFQINKEVRSGVNSHIVADIDAAKPIFKPAGQYSLEEVDNYLMNWELLAKAYEHGLVNTDMLYDAFSYDIEKAWSNPEIQKFVMDARDAERNEDIYGGFEELATKFKETL
jgi:hypothetical protein